MAEYRWVPAREDRWAQMEAEHNARWAQMAYLDGPGYTVMDRIEAKMDLRRHYFSKSSSHGVPNSIEETSTPPCLSHLVSSSMAESNRHHNSRMTEYAREIRESCARILELLQEEMQANESTNDALPTSEETLPSIEPIDEQSPDESVGVKTSMVESVTPIVHMLLLNHDANNSLSGEFHVLNLTKFAHAQLIVPNSMPPLLTPSGRSIQNVTVEFKVTWEHTMLLPPPKPPDRVENLMVRNSNSYADDLVTSRPSAKSPPNTFSMSLFTNKPFQNCFCDDEIPEHTYSSLPIAQVLQYTQYFHNFWENFGYAVIGFAIMHLVEKKNLQQHPLIVGFYFTEFSTSNLKECVIIGNMSTGLIQISGYEHNCGVGGTLFFLHANICSINSAFKLFEKMPTRVLPQVHMVFVSSGPLFKDIMYVLHVMQLGLVDVNTTRERRAEALSNFRKCLEFKEMIGVLSHYEILLIANMVSGVELTYLGAAKGSGIVQDKKTWPLKFRVLNSLIHANIVEALDKHSTLDLLIDFCYGYGCYLLWEYLEILVPSQSLAWHMRNKIPSRIALGLVYHYCDWYFPIVQQEITTTD
jgi:hypothetical protein